MNDKLLFNHLEICSFLYCGNTSQAIQLFLEKQNQLNSLSAQWKKSYLHSLNYGIYNYILINENVALNQCCFQNTERIHYSFTAQTYASIGEEIIRAYGYSSEYLIQRHQNDHVRRAIRYIHEHLHEPLSLDIVCDYININRCYFCDIFKKQVNCSFSQYVLNQRIKLAKKLLKNTDMSINLIVEKCGFNNLSYFCTCFKKVTGHSPCNFRNCQ